MGDKVFIDELIFKPALKKDSRIIAELFSISSDGVADYIWTQIAIEGEDILDIGQKRYEREDSVFSYKNCTVAEIDGNIVGMLVAFPMFAEPSKDLSNTDPVLIPYEKLELEEDNSYYVCGVAVFEEYRGMGIGSNFMKIAENDAKKKGFNKLSLIVFEQNDGAKRLYDRLNYFEVKRERVVPHPLIHYSGDAVLMVKNI